MAKSICTKPKTTEEEVKAVKKVAKKKVAKKKVAKKKVAKKKATKKKETDDVDMYKELAEEGGGDRLCDLDSVKYFIDTGNLAINFSCSGKFLDGGIPGNRITEGYGPNSSGKSLIGSNVLAGAQRQNMWTVLLDCENASNGEFMERVSQVDLKKVIRHTPDSLEKSFQRIHTVTENIRKIEKKRNMKPRPIFFMFDSLSVPPCERELRENDLPENYTAADYKRIVGGKEQPGERAKVISREMRKLQAMVVKEEVTVYIINQIRDKIGVMYGSPETTPGGKAMEFYSSLRFRTASKKKIENKALKKFAGINMQVRNIKNRAFRPFVEANDVKLYFDAGIDCMSGVFACLLQSERVLMSGKGNYIVNPEYSSNPDEEYKFRARQTDNVMPIEVILDNPKLVDAESREEIEEYISNWNTGFEATATGEYEEDEFTYDSDGNPISA